MIDKINVRVYGCVVKNQSVLALFEKYAGENLTKFPGGGLEFGEGLLDCLKREFLEELNLEIKNLHHFYTQEEFVQSKFRENEQILTVYYLAEIVDDSSMEISDAGIQKTELISLLKENPFILPVDRIVFEKLRKHFTAS